MTFTLQGISASKGIALGRVYMLDHAKVEVSEFALPAKHVEEEVERFIGAVDLARQQLHAIREQIPSQVAGEVAAFIDTHLLMLEDAALTAAPIELIRERRCNAEWALKLQRDQMVSVFEAMDDTYLRTRKDDIDHVVTRIQRILLNRGKLRHEHSDSRLAGRIVFADDLTPGDAVLMQHQGVGAFLTEFGGPNSHTAILARSLNIPAVVGLHQGRRYLRDEEPVIVDGREGVVVVDSTTAIDRYYRNRQREIARHHAVRRKLLRAPAVTMDGEPVVLQANVELPADMAAAARMGAQGIGLYRTEFLFMNRERPPDEEEQYEAYVHLVRTLKGAPVTIRTLDLGADKQVDGSRPGAPATINPALGLRAVRLCLKDPGLFRPQLRAILRASAHGPVRLMVPMLSTMQELRQVMHIVDECRRELRREKRAFDEHLPLGAMIEVPAAAVCADIFARHLDFLSIGTNDLIQYTIAIDRIDDEVNYLYDPLHPAVLRLIRMTIRAGARARVPVAMCGEMAGDARYTRLLLGLGLREFSVHPNVLLEVKQAINGSHLGNICRLVERVMRATKPSTRIALVNELNDID